MHMNKFEEKDVTHRLFLQEQPTPVFFGFTLNASTPLRAKISFTRLVLTPFGVLSAAVFKHFVQLHSDGSQICPR
jgi:hypothetical protein